MTVRPRRFALGLTILLVAGALALPAAADGSTIVDGPRAYRASISPSCVTGSGATTFTLALRNTSTQQDLGSADVTLGFAPSQNPTVTVVPSGRRTDATAKPTLDGLQLRGLAAPPGAVVTVTFTAAPASASSPYTIGIVAKQANNFSGPPGNDLQLYGDQPVVHVPEDGACELVAVDCVGEGTCTAETSIGGFGISASGTVADGVGTLALGTFSGGSCEVPDGVTLNTIPESISVAATGLTGKRIVFTIPEEIRKDQPNNGVSAYQVCAEPVGNPAPVGGTAEGDYDTVSFHDRYSGDHVTGLLGVDGKDPGEVHGWLPDCRSGANAVTAPCVSARNGTDDGGVRIEVDFGSSFKFAR